MPIYEYKCTSCEERFEVFQRVGAGNENLVCPSCGAPKPVRQFSAFAMSHLTTGSSSTTNSCNPTSRFR